ncbi:MAG: chloride channel protein [Candidatus Methanofastidiosa archaeon]|nr:chloride channel protein [Candidatus Methanofastidiosa archaeon]
MFSIDRFRLDWKVYLLPVLVGALAGVGAVAFRAIIVFIQNIAFDGKLSLEINDTIPLMSVLGNWVFLVPVVGFFIVGVLVIKFAPEAKGHGVPEVMTAVFTNKGKIRPRVAAIKIIASGICIGTGGSSGREGPIVQIGSSIGSAIGQILKLSGMETTTLLGCGAAAGIAATFNAPLGGILFTIELILPEFSVHTLVPLALSTSVATYIARFLLGNDPTFLVPTYALNSGYELFLYVLLGVLIGVVSILYIKVLYRIEDFFDDLKISPYLKPAIGGFIVGLAALAMFKIYGNYYIFGVGYSTVFEILSGQSSIGILLLLLLVFVKIFATSVTLGSGGSGGIFAPALYIGACFGAAFGLFFNGLIPGIVSTPTAYANVGMGAIVGGTLGAPLTAIIMFFEMTKNYAIILPLTISVVIARAFVHHNSEGTIYEIKLLRKGIKIPHERAIDMLSIAPVKDIMEAYDEDGGDLPKIYQYSSLQEALILMNEKKVNEVLATNKSGNPIGVVKKDDILYFYTNEKCRFRKR